MRYLTLIIFLFMLAPDLAAQAWVEVVPLNVPRRDAAIAVLDGEIYVMGGQDAAGNPLGSVERLTENGGWQLDAPLREARYLAASVTYQGQIVLIGGSDDSGGATDDVEVYNSEEEDWESFQSLVQERQGLGAVVLGGRIYAVGGAAEDGQLLATCEVYDGEEWYDYPFWELDAGRAAFGLTVESDVAYYAGGFGEFGPSRTMRRYSVSTGTDTLPPMPTARGSLALVSDGEAIYAIGGLDAADQTLDVVERYDIASGEWEPFAPLAIARSGAAATFLDGKVYVIGGRDENGTPLASVEVLGRPPVSAEATATPSGAALDLPYPNPFADRTRFTLRLGTPAVVSLRIYDVRGRAVATLLDGPVPAGSQPVVWDGRGDDGRRLASGLYIARLTGMGTPLVRPVTLLR